MRILDRIKERININNASEDRKKLLALKDDVASLQQLDHYIGVREYTNHMHTYQKLMDEIMMMEEKDLLFSYSKKQHISVKEIKE